MTIKLPRFKQINTRRWLPWIPLSTFVGLLLLLALLIYFLYRNFYQTIAQIKVVYVLRTQIALTQVNVDLYQSISKSWENKKKIDPIINQISTDPFVQLSQPKTAGDDKNNLTGLDKANQIIP
ncbi:MAG: hypothetical protein WC621_03840 [Patescibacteria group bacterium]